MKTIQIWVGVLLWSGTVALFILSRSDNSHLFSGTQKALLATFCARLLAIVANPRGKQIVKSYMSEATGFGYLLVTLALETRLSQVFSIGRPGLITDQCKDLKPLVWSFL